MNNIPYLLALHSVDGLGPIRLKALLDYFKDPKLIWDSDGREIKSLGIPQNVIELLIQKRRELDPEVYSQSIGDRGIKWVSMFDDYYPKLLKEIYDPPVILYYKGDILSENENAIGVVGTRKMTGYGKVVTEKFVSGLVQAGLTIVSGLARGVDSQSHITALKENGRTIAVLGGGLNNIYPPENRDLVLKIIDGHGAVISEYPPDYPSMPGNFPSRNRIISGLSKAVLVTEAAQDSGSLITARLALEQGRDVFAVPGPITSDLSKGPISLIREGAKIVTEASEILEELGIRRESRIMNQAMPAGRQELRKELTDEEKKVLECLGNDTMHIDEICRKLDSPPSSVSGILIKMEIVGLVQNLGSGSYCKS